MSAIVTAEYRTFFKEIKERIHKAQYDALKFVNKELINQKNSSMLCIGVKLPCFFAVDTSQLCCAVIHSVLGHR
jgi:hypothetical protein